MKRTSRREDGSASILMLGLGIALTIAIGLAVDGSRKSQAYSTATAVAEEAARAGEQAIPAAALAAGTDARVTPGLAIAAAQRYLAAAGATGTVAVNGDQLTVDTTITKPTIFLGAIGVSTMTVHGHGTAVLVSNG